MSEFDLRGTCAFCNNSNHEFPDDSWHEMKHMSGWHSCEVFGGFRFSKPGCNRFELSEGVVFSKK